MLNYATVGIGQTDKEGGVNLLGSEGLIMTILYKEKLNNTGQVYLAIIPGKYTWQ